MSDNHIAILLPPREGFGAQHFGAISLCVRDFIAASQFKATTHVFGAVDVPAFEGTTFHHLPLTRKFWQSEGSAYVRAFAKAINNGTYRIAEIHNRPHYVPSLRRLWNGSISLHLHNDPLEMRGAKTASDREKLITICDAIYCVSDFIRQQFLHDIPAGLHDKVHVIYNGLARDSLPSPPETKAKEIVFVGRMKAEKGALEFAQALAEILPKHPAWKALFIGADRHAPNQKITAYEASLYHAIAPIESQVRFCGFLSHEQTMQHYAGAAIAVIPSRWNEAFGRTALEAMAMGCATISSLRGGLAEVVEDAALPLHDVTAAEIAQQLELCIADEKLRMQYQQAALKQAAKFDVAISTAHMDNVRAQIISHNSPASKTA